MAETAAPAAPAVTAAPTDAPAPAPAAEAKAPEAKGTPAAAPARPLKASMEERIAAATKRIEAASAPPKVEAKAEGDKTPAETPAAKEKAEKPEPKADAKEPEKPAEEKKDPPPKVDEDELAKDPKVAEKLAFIAKREAALKADHTKRMAEVNAQAEKWGAIEKAMDAFDRDPVGALRSLLKGDTKAQIALAEQMYLDAVGDSKDAPPEVKTKRELLAIQRKMEAMERAQQERERQAEERIQHAELSRQAEAYKGTLAEAALAAKDYPHVAAYMAHNRDETIEALANLAGTVMKQDPETYGDGTLPKPAEIVAALEQSLKEELAWVRPLYAPPPAPVAPAAPKPEPPPADEQKPAPKTLSGAKLAPKTQPRTKAVTDDEKIQRAVKRLEQLGA